jgi:hypothetical protein
VRFEGQQDRGARSEHLVRVLVQDREGGIVEREAHEHPDHRGGTAQPLRQRGHRIPILLVVHPNSTAPEVLGPTLAGAGPVVGPQESRRAAGRQQVIAALVLEEQRPPWSGRRKRDPGLGGRQSSVRALHLPTRPPSRCVPTRAQVTTTVRLRLADQTSSVPPGSFDPRRVEPPQTIRGTEARGGPGRARSSRDGSRRPLRGGASSTRRTRDGTSFAHVTTGPRRPPGVSRRIATQAIDGATHVGSSAPQRVSLRSPARPTGPGIDRVFPVAPSNPPTPQG